MTEEQMLLLHSVGPGLYNDSNMAVRFGTGVDPGFQVPGRSYPFMYNFVRPDDDTWDRDKIPGQLENLVGMGPALAPGQTRLITINLDPDYNFYLQFIKFNVLSPSCVVGNLKAGTVSTTANSAAVVGVGTTFLADYLATDTIIFERNEPTNQFAIRVVSVVTDNLNLTVDRALPFTQAGMRHFKAFENLTGTATIAVNSTALTGVGTAFLTELAANDFIRIGNVIVQVASITNNTTAVLSAPAVVSIGPLAFGLCTHKFYEWYEDVAGWDLMGNAWFDYQDSYGTKLERDIRATLTMYGPDGRHLYGGQAVDVANQGANRGVVNNLHPINLHSLQGYDYGPGQISDPHLLPKSGSVELQVTNNNAQRTIVVGGMLYGYKVMI